MRSLNSWFRLCIALASITSLAAAFAIPARGQALQASSVNDINPDTSTLHGTDADGSAGGRVNGLAISAGTRTVVYAASEWGGLFKSLDRGNTWEHVDSHVPAALWRVAVDPSNSHRVVTTSFYDGRIKSMSGINISTDDGLTWTHPSSAIPPKDFCSVPAFQRELTAFGVVFERDNPQNVYVGTSCGLAISTNSGETWRYIDPTINDPADTIWDVIVHDGGILDLCGNDGHARSRNRGQTWEVPHQLPTGRCSIAVSPYEADVLFEVVGERLYESDDGGQHWGTGVLTPNFQGRVPFVTTNKRSNGEFDLWFGDVELYKVACRTPTSSAVPTQRCKITSWGEPYTRKHGAHDDAGQIIFEPDVNVNACPILFSSDGGVYLNAVTSDPDCQVPNWDQPKKKGPHSLWFFGMDVVATAGGRDIYFGNQDSGAFYGQQSQSEGLNWANFDCCDSFTRAASTHTLLYNRCCYEDKKNPVRENQLFLADPGVIKSHQLGNYPKGLIPGWEARAVEHFDGEAFVVLTTVGVFRTPNIRAEPVHWDQLGGTSFPADACGVTVSGTGKGSHLLFLQGGDCDGRVPSSIYHLDEKTTPARWVRVQPPPHSSGFGVFATGDNGKEILAVAFAADSKTPAVMVSHDGGQSWTPLANLDSLLTANGALSLVTEKGPTDFTGFKGYPQPSALGIDPINPLVLVAAGVDAGVFLSTDGGITWAPIESSTGRVIPRVRQIQFVNDNGRSDVYLGSQGAGIWSFRWQASPSGSAEVQQ